ncbi:MAG TPA: cytochrome c-type biogenesis protein CcmH [Terriglobia bacterium]|nr:cytochrome c-type biogenesis protein CcmH [Terriglobia bacterium]
MNFGSLALTFLMIGSINSQAEQGGRIAHLENALLAPCCYREPVSRHQSEEAAALRSEITKWVAEGKSDREILEYCKARYGLAVLAEPDGIASQVVYGTPIIALFSATFGLIWLIRKWAFQGFRNGCTTRKLHHDHPPSDSEVPEEFRRRIEIELRGLD